VDEQEVKEVEDHKDKNEKKEKKKSKGTISRRKSSVFSSEADSVSLSVEDTSEIESTKSEVESSEDSLKELGKEESSTSRVHRQKRSTSNVESPLLDSAGMKAEFLSLLKRDHVFRQEVQSVLFTEISTMITAQKQLLDSATAENERLREQLTNQKK